MTVSVAKEKPGREVDADLSRRSAMVAGDGTDDLVVALGLRAAGRISGAGLSAEELIGLGTPYAVAAGAGDSLGKDTAASIRLFYDLWYRLKIPFGCGSLQWWYLLCLVLRDSDRSPEGALVTASGWIERLEAAPKATQPALFAELTGLLPDTETVLADDEYSDVEALARAVATQAPLLLSARRRPAPVLSGLVRDTREAWCELAPEDCTALLIELEQRVLSLEQIRLSTGTEVLNNAAVAAGLRRCLEEHPSRWPVQNLALATLVWCWRDAGFVIHELNQSLLFLPTLAVFFEKRIDDYDAVLGTATPPCATLREAALLLAARRAEIEKSHLRCIFFDGSNWERREFLIERTSLADNEVLPAGLGASLERRFEVPFEGGGGSLEAWDRYLEAVLERGDTPTDLVRCLAEWAANAPDLPVDYAIFTAPQGVKLDRPWELELTEVFCYTAFRCGIEPAESGVPFDFIGIQNAIGQRMRYNVVKKAQNYALVRRFPAQSFNLPDIAIGEDANHGGHRAGGIRLSCRLPTTIGWCGRTWKGLADVRLNRLDYTAAEPFKPSEVPIAFRYVKWEKGIVDATYRRGLLFDALYCSKLEKGTNGNGDA